MAKNTVKATKAVREDGKIRIRQIGGTAGRNPRVRATLCALGLGRIGHESELPSNPSVLGMIRKVNSIVTVIK